MSLLGNRNNDFEKKLKQQLDDTEFKPSESLWSRIDQEVNRPEFEKKVEGKLGSYEVTPKPESWEIIEAQLPPEPGSKKTRTVWYISLMLLLFSGVWAGYLLNQTANEKIGMLPNPKTVSINSDVQKNQETQIGVAEPGNQVEVKVKHEPEQAHSSLKQTPKRVHSTPSYPISNRKQRLDKSQVSVAQVPADISQNKVVSNEQRKAASNEITIPSQGENHTAGVNQNSSSNQRGEVDHTILKQPENILEKNASNNSIIPPASVVLEDSSKIKSKSEAIVGVKDSARQTNPQAQLTPLSDTLTPANRFIDNSQVVSAPAVGPKISITIVAGMHESMMRLTAPSEGNFGATLALREQIEIPRLGITTGFMLDYHLPKQWMISSGIMITGFNMDMNYGIRTAQSTPITETGATYKNVGDSITANGFENTRIMYSWNEIPVILTYQFSSNNRWRAEARVGLSYAITSTVDAAMVGHNNVGILVVKDKDAFPRINNLFFGSVMFGIQYQLNNDVSIGFTPYLKYSLNSMVERKNWIQQYPIMGGAALSLRKHF